MSTIVTDTITGKSTATTITIGSTPVVSASANSMTIRGEGSAQTSIQQGLCKHWINLNGQSTPAVRDSFNAGSITDNGTGDFSIAITNNMGNGNYSINTGLAAYDGGGDYRYPIFIKANAANDWSTMATSSYRVQCNQAANGVAAADPSLVNKGINGDLA
jgi:hypothetical protein